MESNLDQLYPPSLLNVRTVNEQGLWGKPLRIGAYEVREFEPRDPSERRSRKLVLKFEGADTGLALNATNAKTLGRAWGRDYKTWVGRQLKLVRIRVLFRGEQRESVGVEAVSEPKIEKIGQ